MPVCLLWYDHLAHVASLRADCTWHPHGNEMESKRRGGRLLVPIPPRTCMHHLAELCAVCPVILLSGPPGPRRAWFREAFATQPLVDIMPPHHGRQWWGPPVLVATYGNALNWCEEMAEVAPVDTVAYYLRTTQGPGRRCASSRVTEGEGEVCVSSHSGGPSCTWTTAICTPTPVPRRGFF